MSRPIGNLHTIIDDEVMIHVVAEEKSQTRNASLVSRSIGLGCIPTTLSLGHLASLHDPSGGIEMYL